MMSDVPEEQHELKKFGALGIETTHPCLGRSSQ